MNRSLLIDGLKALLSQLIVLHHLSVYSPMADAVTDAWPWLVDLLVDQGPLAVQAFFVMGGWLTARSLYGRPVGSVTARVFQRYLRLAPPLVIALLLVMGATALVGEDLAGSDWLSPLPDWRVFGAHVLLLQDVLDIPALSAGVWYVAIDLQLFMAFVLLAWACDLQRLALTDGRVLAALCLVCMASALHFSHEEYWEPWAIHYIWAYGLGALAAWAALDRRARPWWWCTVALLAIDGLWTPAWERLIWTLVTALALYGSRRCGNWDLNVPERLRRLTHGLSDLSYGVFVGHFASIVLVSGLWVRWKLEGAALALMVIAGAWMLALGTGWLVQRMDRLLHNF